ncbi:Leukotriene A-4 hydrolase [Fasciola hepatica]|uniref:Leukotriene A-4 hydrolase n=1 Tax=Fasciola hepatica TaxID=6192 RepID=A0A4E0R355_FASHE|nr:Leukotriene A-4 hydrolase [Fasciola hepatica]
MPHFYDPSSSANASDYHTAHIKFDWNIDFTTKTIGGAAVLTIKRVSHEKAHPPLILDANELSIQAVKIHGNDVQWKCVPHKHPVLGSVLEVTVPSSDPQFDVEIAYKTSPNSSALQWLEPELTADRKLPFMFSQCQAIHARSLFPCQDTPSVKATFEAVVHAPKEAVVVMGGVRTKQPSVSNRGDQWMTYHYEQTIPIPSYLVTIACGDLASERVGPRSSVWAERSVVAKAAKEFADIEKMLAAAEHLCGPYVWKVYDVLVLPPSFPYGGMENPCLTFVSPTLLAGDKSLVNVIAHEIAHSWTGNFVTNSNWEHFWLNEGHTIYLERLIMEYLHGTQMRHLLLAIGYEELLNEVKHLGTTHEFTRLVTKLDGVDPDVSYNRIPYEKGSLLLYYLETKFGRDKMMHWLKAYVKHFGGSALDTNSWVEFLSKTLGEEAQKNVNWDEWLHAPGMPSWKPKFEAEEAIAQCDSLVALFESDELSTKSAVTASVLKLWKELSPIQRELTMRRLNKRPELKHENLRAIDAALELSKQQNAELRFEWSHACIRSHYLPALDSCLEFLNSTGRMRYTRPLYRSLKQWPEVLTRVHENYKNQRPFMHRTSATLLAADLGVN